MSESTRQTLIEAAVYGGARSFELALREHEASILADEREKWAEERALMETVIEGIRAYNDELDQQGGSSPGHYLKPLRALDNTRKGGTERGNTQCVEQN